MKRMWFVCISGPRNLRAHFETHRRMQPSIGNLRTNLKTHSGEKPNKCNQCDYASSRADHLRQHLKTHSVEKPNKCDQCDFSSFEVGNLMQHLKTHSGEKSNKCNLCDYAYSHAGNLRIHLKTHSGEKSNKCNQCNFASTWPADLRIHFKSHSGEKSIDAASVIMHPLEQATLGTTWKCTIEFSSVHSKSLRFLLMIHSGEKSNQCNQCHYVCCDPSALRRHLKTHIGEKTK